MKPAPFAYHAPQELDEAVGLLAAGEQAGEMLRVLAGGQSLVPMMNFRLAAPDALVDIGRISALRYARSDSDGTLRIGAGTRQSELLHSSDIAARFPLLAEGVRHIGHPQIRNRGTVCGSLAHHDPTAELPALAVALGASVGLISTTGRRELAADKFLVSYYQVALEPGDMVEQVSFPALAPGSGWGFRELARRRGDFAIAGVVCLTPSRDGQGVARLVAFGIGERPARITEAEAELERASGNELDLEAIRAAVMEAVRPKSDLHASSEYRRTLVAELAVQCASDAWERRS